MKLLKSKKAISPLIATVLLLGLTIVTGVLVIGMVTNWFRGASNIEAIDASKTMVYLDQTYGKGKILMILKNTGTSTLRLYRIGISCKIDPSYIAFTASGAQITNGTTVTGLIYGSSGSVTTVLSGSQYNLFIPPGQTATIELTYTSGMTALFDVGNSYRATIYSAATAGGITSFVFNVDAS